MNKSFRVCGGVVVRRAVWAISMCALMSWGTMFAQEMSQRIVLDKPVILVDKSEVSYVQYAAKDLGAYQRLTLRADPKTS